MNEEKIKISVNEEDVQNIINCYEKDIKYIERLEHNWNELKKWLKDEAYWGLEMENCFNTREMLSKMQSLEEGGNNE